MQRRSVLKFMAGTGLMMFMAKKSFAAEKVFPVTMTDENWKKKLSSEAYNVLRHEATEPPFTSALNDEHAKGIFTCAGCDTKLFSSTAKFDSGTGWPSFFEPINDKAVETTIDYKLIYPRVEVHCLNCGGHLGHVFEDGPKPTGLRYCMNGVAMKFTAAKT